MLYERHSIVDGLLSMTGSIAIDETSHDDLVDPSPPLEVVADGRTSAKHLLWPAKRFQSRTVTLHAKRRDGSGAAAGHRNRGDGTKPSWLDCWPCPTGPVTKVSCSAIDQGPRYPRSASCHLRLCCIFAPMRLNGKRQLATVSERVYIFGSNLVGRLRTLAPISQTSCR